jgi:RHH-type proline utilization regulon transcriptional repressor/proline dehydrogenase/delta 1-pyrroline-5-carboxylate dehydrogenase
LTPFNAPYAERDETIAARFLAGAALPSARDAAIDAEARGLINAIRSHSAGFGGVEEMLREYSLSTQEGLALMTLAEALLRVPDAATQDRLIEDRLGQADFEHHAARSGAVMTRATTWALGLSSRIVQPGDTPGSLLAGLTRRLGTPAVRAGARQAMRVMGGHFVLGETIGAALKRAGSGAGRVYRYSFDMLGEGARTQADAQRYAASYAYAITAIGQSAGNQPLPDRPGISVKLSALHPRYEATNAAAVLAELVPVVTELARQARGHELNFTIDAEEADRLELSLDVIAAVLADPALAGWDGFGLAIQAYQKRSGAVIGWVAELAERLDRRLMVRLVKGAYWDTEVKRAQQRGLDDYPVFTRKPMTDLSYMDCAVRLLAARPRIYPQFATHNALTVAAIIDRAGGTDGYEFQRLHGMGEALYAHLLATRPGVACRTYAPVGGHGDLLAYLVRRLLENGANSSFVAMAGDPAVPIDALLERPAAQVGGPSLARNAAIPLPGALLAPRRNSAGVELGHRETLASLLDEVRRGGAEPFAAGPVIDGATLERRTRLVRSPIDGSPVGMVAEDAALADPAIKAAAAGFASWAGTPAEDRAAALERAADLMESKRGKILFLLQTEAGKTIDDALAELREAVDFCRYYAQQGRILFGAETVLPGPTGERNTLRLRGRGVFVAIAPWNFPLAIFVGQVAAALMAGNTVVAKPAEQTPLVAGLAVALLHRAGVPGSALHVVPGDGAVGARLVAHPAVAGVVFTGSTAVARHINRALAAKDGPIVPLIAETGGINAMIVDSTALPEQVADDVLASAFRSAGQRCSALRLLCVQDTVADRVIEMVVGAAQTLRVGDPRETATAIGPVIDQAAHAALLAHIAATRATAVTHLAPGAPPGLYVGPHVFELTGPEALEAEVFGPVLHVVRWRGSALEPLLETLSANGYGLTLGVQSRMEATAALVTERMATGNIYINRNMIGAVVGVQPFGGHGLSGTGPKAGGPHYLLRFATEQTVSVNTAAAGGNAALLAGGG